MLTDMWVQGTLVAGYPPVSSGNINGGTGYAGGQIIVYGYSSMGVASNYPGVAVLTINGPGVPPATTPASPIPALYLNNPNTTTDSTTIALTAQGNVSISDGTLTVNGSAVQGAAAAFVRNDGDGACLSCTASRSAPRSTTGVTIEVATAEDHGFGTNGLIHSTAGSAPLTHLPTRAGRRVVTSPLSLAAEVHASGTARLSQGRADVELDAGLADLVVHRDDAPYRVLLTPGGSCNGLAVTAKRAGGFTVEELGGGRSDVAFDWLLIGAKRRALDSDEAASLPEELPRRGA